MEPDELARRVNSKESFKQFLLALREDWNDSRRQEERSPSSPYEPAANGWENTDIGRFLGAMIDWIDTRYSFTGELNVPEEPSWQTFAYLFCAAKIYE